MLRDCVWSIYFWRTAACWINANWLISGKVKNTSFSSSVNTSVGKLATEPQPANVYVFNGAKGTFIVKNPELEKLLIEKNKNVPLAPLNT